VTGRVVVVGLAATGASVTSRLRSEGMAVTVLEDRPAGPAYEQRAATARAEGATVVEAPDDAAVERAVTGASLLVPSPLVDERHPAVVTARRAGIPVRSEIDLAAERARVPIVAITGTNGKTTVTSLVEAMLAAGGRKATAAGNIGTRTLLDAVDDDVDVLVAEVSSFQLAFCELFRPWIAVLLAVAPDHLDWHGGFEQYAAAKAKIFARQRDDDLLVYDADDPVAAELASKAPARRVAITLGAPAPASFGVRDGFLAAPDGGEIARIADLRRALPHDISNALAATAAALAAGARLDGVRAALASYATLPHRVALVGEARGVKWYDDSKATNPHAASHAVRAFDSVVLLAGGRNKGLDLSLLTEATDHLRAVVAFGEAGDDVARAFEHLRPVTRVQTMHEAVIAADTYARPGDTVLLSPGCASFDAYTSYGQRGDDFASEVAALVGRSRTNPEVEAR
jgi:UDP-N-acetylmuramoylalanine--D-glutamate ligase